MHIFLTISKRKKNDTSIPLDKVMFRSSIICALNYLRQLARIFLLSLSQVKKKKKTVMYQSKKQNTKSRIEDLYLNPTARKKVLCHDFCLDFVGYSFSRATFATF